MGNKQPSRSQRFATAQDVIAGVQVDVEALRDELQDWLDNMPENLQQGAKAEALQDAIDELETCLEDLEEVATAVVDFPGMF